MSDINFQRRLLVFIISTMLLSHAFYTDPLGIIESGFSKFWREVSEFFVVGRLVKSQHDGILSGGALLVIGDASDYDVTNKVIQHQYDAYSRAERFDTYWTYKSTPAFEGMIYSVFDKITTFSPGENIKLFRISVSLFSAIIIGLLLLWIEIEFGFLAFLLALMYTYGSPWLVLFGGHIYWQMWSFFLPFTSILLLNEYASRTKSSSVKPFVIVAFVTLFLKTLFSGFEFITPVLVSITVPGVYFFLKNRQSLRYFFQMFTCVSFGGLLGTVSGLSVLLLQISSELGDFASSYQYIYSALNRRAIGDPSEFSGVYASALSANVWEVLGTYASGPALAFDGNFTGGIYDGGVRYISLILLVFIFSLILLLVIKYIPSVEKRKSIAILITSWYSILAPLSWLIVFKAHASIHINLDYFVWQVPFLLLGFALIGWSTVQLFSAYICSSRPNENVNQLS